MNGHRKALEYNLFSPAFFWMWNAPLDVAALCAQLEDMRAHGLRNVCIHPFPKGFRPDSCPSEMAPDYLTPGFLDVFAAVVRHAGELGMHAYLYDEGGWPSGGACGRVAASDLENRFAPREMASAPDGAAQLRARPYGAGASTYPSLVEPGATRKFLDLTHEAYAHRLGGALGTTVRIAFTDEPDMPHDTPGCAIAWTSDFADEFMRRKGYDLLPHIPALLADAKDADPALSRFRIDLQDVRSDLFVERYLAPLRDWCHAHGMLSGGHLNNEDEPELEFQLGHGSLLRSLKAMDVPGVDVIWRQLYPGGTANPFPRYAASAMHQNGGRFALSESFAIFGDSLSPAEMKWVVDYELVCGINLFVLAYCAQSNAKHWMTLFEPHFGPDSPTWDFLPHFFGYVERASRFLSRGRPGAEIAVLMNSRAFWANASDRDSAAVAHYAVSRELESMNCDFDFVEDRDIASAELTAGGRIRIGAMEYGAIVLPDATWMLPKSKETLARFEAAGGIVAHGPGELAKVPRTLRVDGDGARAIRVMKRIDADSRVWFLMNEDMSPQEVEIEFPGAGPIVRYDPEQDAFEGVPVCPGRKLLRTFRPGETSIYVTGANVAAALPPSPSGTSIQLSTGWTLRPLVSHVAGADDFEIVACTDPERATSLGDWRPVLGETFCGKVRYRVEFEVGEACNAIVDLGEVKWCAALSLNGTEIGSRFFGPFLWEVHLSKGRNVLEVTIANLLANQVGCDAVRDRILRDWQPNGSYDIHMRPFDKCNHESGLFGPVMVHCSRDIYESHPKQPPRRDGSRLR